MNFHKQCMKNVESGEDHQRGIKIYIRSCEECAKTHLHDLATAKKLVIELNDVARRVMRGVTNQVSFLSRRRMPVDYIESIMVIKEDMLRIKAILEET